MKLVQMHYGIVWHRKAEEFAVIILSSLIYRYSKLEITVVIQVLNNLASKILEKKLIFFRNKTISQSDQFPLWKHKFMAKAKKFRSSLQKENLFLGGTNLINFWLFFKTLATGEAFLLPWKLLKKFFKARNMSWIHIGG